MFRPGFLSLLVLVGCGSGAPSAPAGVGAGGDTAGPPGSFADGIPATFFGMGIQHPTTPIPLTSALGTLPVAGLRLWDSGVNWSQIETCNPAGSPGVAASNPANPCYHWQSLDGYVNAAPAQPMDVLYTFGALPDWAANVAAFSPPPNGCSGGTHACLPPLDLNADGTGADSIWSSFVAALVTRYKSRIKYYELWNEPDAPNFWHGTIQQLVRMSKDAAGIIRATDPAARILSPSFHGPTTATWFEAQYLANGARPYFDIVNFHGRSPNDNADPESFLAIYAQAQSALQSAGVANLPFWDDEAGPLDGDIADFDNGAAYVSRALIVRASKGMARFYYAQWDAKPPFGIANSIAATAYAVTAGWLTGAHLGACLQAGSSWTCPVTRPNGFQAQLLWDTGQRCTNGVCTTNQVPIDATYIRYFDLTGASVAIANHLAPVGIKPILLSNLP